MEGPRAIEAAALPLSSRISQIGATDHGFMGLHLKPLTLQGTRILHVGIMP